MSITQPPAGDRIIVSKLLNLKLNGCRTGEGEGGITWYDSVGMLTRARCVMTIITASLGLSLHMPSHVLYKVTIGLLARTLVLSLSLCLHISVRRIPSLATVDRQSLFLSFFLSVSVSTRLSHTHAHVRTQAHSHSSNF